MTDLRIRALTKSYDGTPVLDGLDLHVPAGLLVAVLGPSGCGKTTLLRIIAGFLRADSGTVTLGERTVVDRGVDVPPQRRNIGIVAQEGALFPHLSVARNVSFGLKGLKGLKGLSGTERAERTERMLELVGLAGFGDRMPHELSGGQQQRVALARALAPRPALVLLDEPFNALDSALRAGVRADVRAALRATGATAVLVTHDQQEALSTADLVAVVRDGRVAQLGTPEEVYRSPVDAWVAAFVGDAVVLPATVADGAATTCVGPVPLAGADRAANGEGTVVLRPEQLRLVEPGAAPVTGTVRDICFYGHDALVSVEPEGGSRRVEVRHPGAVTVRPGDRVGLAVTGPALLQPVAEAVR